MHAKDIFCCTGTQVLGRLFRVEIKSIESFFLPFECLIQHLFFIKIFGIPYSSDEQIVFILFGKMSSQSSIGDHIRIQYIFDDFTDEIESLLERKQISAFFFRIDSYPYGKLIKMLRCPFYDIFVSVGYRVE